MRAGASKSGQNQIPTNMLEPVAQKVLGRSRFQLTLEAERSLPRNTCGCSPAITCLNGDDKKQYFLKSGFIMIPLQKENIDMLFVLAKCFGKSTLCSSFVFLAWEFLSEESWQMELSCFEVSQLQEAQITIPALQAVLPTLEAQAVRGSPRSAELIRF